MLSSYLRASFSSSCSLNPFSAGLLGETMNDNFKLRAEPAKLLNWKGNIRFEEENDTTRETSS